MKQFLNGVQYLQTVTNTNNYFKYLCIGLIVLSIVLIYFLIKKNTNKLYKYITFTILLFTILTCLYSSKLDYRDSYKVTVSNEVKANDLFNFYDVIEVNENIYTVRIK